MARIVAVTACPTGIAHTIMAAEALKKTAALMGHEIRVETQGSEGVRNSLSDREIETADVVIVAADITVDMDRFEGKPAYACSTSEAWMRGGPGRRPTAPSARSCRSFWAMRDAGTGGSRKSS